MGLEGDRAIRVTLSGAGGEGLGPVAETIVLGVEAPRSGSIYAKREGGDPGVFVVDGNVRPWLENPLAALRDRKLLAAPVGAVVQLVIRQASGEIALQRRITQPKQEWALAAPLVSWADREAMDELLTALGGLRIEEVVKDAPGSGEIPDPLPAGTAVLQVQVHGIERPLTIFMRKVGDADDGRPVLEARASDRPAVYRFKSDFLAALPKSPNDLRDRTLARIPLEYLDSIKIQSRIDPLVDLRAERSGPNVSWKVALSNKLLPANANEVNALVTAVNEAAIQRFVSDEATDLAGYGLVPPQRRIVFDLKLPGTPLADGTPGAPRPLLRVLNLGWKEGEDQRLYANFEGEPHVYELDPTFLNLIATHPVKWKSLNVITFNPVHLVSITREIPEKDNLKLDYDYRPPSGPPRAAESMSRTASTSPPRAASATVSGRSPRADGISPSPPPTRPSRIRASPSPSSPRNWTGPRTSPSSRPASSASRRSRRTFISDGSTIRRTCFSLITKPTAISSGP